ncbi:glutamyl-tRNA reductase [Candidatus Pantoea edessiphila]|uniref:Glutamyl-tRNA reductase n=1 Tax=Candidatus Pantoea edessiphila TaxID=2044610 RepID=A0A2P5SYT0_9GAMM|nr:glutamyl-tRNA reductase [Candidatus Pantoea edessiphila]MBK4775369.1 glutamyl-tRNA reductase [Pantoea sp. Edef]PPI87499.1 glutamyl-tRNA reductase [Candidatus Pantoea edessiphila]
MTLLVLGVNHKTAPLSLRERLSFGPEIISKALNNLLLSQSIIQSAILLSTCNRVEIYISVDQEINSKEYLISWLCQYHKLNKSEVHNSIYCYKDKEAVSHLIRVTSGLDSMILGESQIFGQVKEAFAISQKNNSVNSEINQMFQKTFHAVKRIRSETDIGSNAISIAYATCTLSRKIFKCLSKITVLLIGAGKTINLVAYYLRKYKIKKIIISNRTRSHAEVLASQVNAEVVDQLNLSNYLHKADLIISSTSSRFPIITKVMLEQSIKSRYNKELFLIDIAVPADIELEVNKLPNTYLYRVDDLKDIIDTNLVSRKLTITKAENIIMQESNKFMLWLKSQKESHSVRKYREQVEDIRVEMEKKALHALQKGDDPQKVMQELIYKLTNRLIHAPTKSLQQAARNGDKKRLKILCDSLGLS